MGNCDNKEFVDDNTYTRQFGVEDSSTKKDPNEEFEKLMHQPFDCKKEVEIEDPLYTLIKRVIQQETKEPKDSNSTKYKDNKKELFSTKLNEYKNGYRIKKNLKCAHNVIYTMNVIERKSDGKMFIAKSITRDAIRNLGEDQFKILFENEIKILEKIKRSFKEKQKNNIGINNNNNDNLQLSNFEQIEKIFLLTMKGNFKLIIITNLTSQITLLDIINEHIQQHKKFTKKEIGHIANKLLLILSELKSLNILFRNISPDNIAFTNPKDLNTLVIRNFNFAKDLGKSQTTSGICGGLWYMAPEMLRDLKYDYKLDVWGVGMILYEMITLENPFSECESRDMMLNLLKKRKAFKKKDQINKFEEEVNVDFVFKMLEEKTNARVSCELLLEDNFIKDYQKEINEQKQKKN